MGQADPHHPRARRAEHERRAAGPGRRRVEDAVVDGVEPPVEVGPAVAHQLPDDGEGLLEPRDPVVEGEPEGGVLPLVPAGAEAEDAAAHRRFASTVAAIFASIAGAWNHVDATNGPSSTRDVTAARAASDVQTSQGPLVTPPGRS